MTVLTEQQRQEAARRLIRQAFEELNLIATLTVPQVKSAIDAIDDYFEANATSINQAFPADVRSAASLQLKAMIVGIVAFKRAGLI